MTTIVNSTAPVLALTVIEAGSLGDRFEITSQSRILLAVRDAETNASHPDVVSVPTQRIPWSTFESLQQTTSIETALDASTSIFKKAALKNYSQSGHHELIFCVNSLLATKLGVSEALERKTLRYTAFLRALVTGTVFHPSHSEPTSMLNSVVIVESGSAHFPTRTASYSHLLWCPVEQFVATAIEKNPLTLDPSLNPIRYCIHGMCIKSAFNVVADYLRLAPYPYDPYNPTSSAGAPSDGIRT